MNNNKKSKKLLFVATALTILSLASVLTVYAAVLLGTINGGAVTVGGVTSGTITYNTADDGTGTWNPNLEPSGAWYTRLIVTGGYVGPVTITWQLQSYATGSWANVGGATVTTNVITLDGGSQTFYAIADGVTLLGSRNWSLDATTGGTYRVIATINSAP